MFTNEELQDPKQVSAKLTEVVEFADTTYNHVKAEYDEAREYYEHDQEPASKPAGKTYVSENLITDLIHRLIGDLVVGKFTPVVKGGGVMASAIRELFLDILDKNKFQKQLISQMANYFYVEGIAYFKGNFNPFRKTRYGYGFPELFVLRPEEGRLDPNSSHPYHTDDIIRVHKVTKRVDEVKQRYPKFAQRIAQTFDESRPANETEHWTDIYEIQFMRTEHVKTEGGIWQEYDEYFVAKMVNKVVMVEPPMKSKYRRFTIVPVIHTPRHKSKQYPMGVVFREKQNQDSLNVSSSIIEEAVKASIKMTLATTGARNVDEAKVRRQLTKPDGYVNFEGSNVKLHQLYPQPLVRPVVEYHEMVRHRFDDMVSKYAPSRGEVAGDLSGKAISLLQARGVEPEFVMKANIESALVEVGWFVLECMKMKMQYPFKITRKIDGQNRDIYYNTPIGDVSDVQQDEYNSVHNGFYNPLGLMDLGSMDFDMDVEMNVMGKQEVEINKAILMRNQNALALKDYMKIMYPNDWKEKLDNVTAENQAQALVQMIGEVAQTQPELVDTVMGQIQTALKLSGNGKK